MWNVKGEKSQKQQEKQQLVTDIGKPRKTISEFSRRNSAGKKGVAWYIQSAERKLPTKNTSSGKVVLHNWRRDKESSKQVTKRIHHH